MPVLDRHSLYSFSPTTSQLRSVATSISLAIWRKSVTVE
jgi:hypothetical protein